MLSSFLEKVPREKALLSSEEEVEQVSELSLEREAARQERREEREGRGSRREEARQRASGTVGAEEGRTWPLVEEEEAVTGQ